MTSRDKASVKTLPDFRMVISPADNPVGALFERYQTSGAPMPEIEVAIIIFYFKIFESRNHATAVSIIAPR